MQREGLLQPLDCFALSFCIQQNVAPKRQNLSGGDGRVQPRLTFSDVAVLPFPFFFGVIGEHSYEFFVFEAGKAPENHRLYLSLFATINTRAFTNMFISPVDHSQTSTNRMEEHERHILLKFGSQVAKVTGAAGNAERGAPPTFPLRSSQAPSVADAWEIPQPPKTVEKSADTAIFDKTVISLWVSNLKCAVVFFLWLKILPGLATLGVWILGVGGPEDWHRGRGDVLRV